MVDSGWVVGPCKCGCDEIGEAGREDEEAEKEAEDIEKAEFAKGS